MTEQGRSWLNSQPINLGVPLDADQQPLSECAFVDCRASSRVEPLYGIIYEKRLLAVCQRCYRERLRKP